jgi:hypothetical protein
LCDAVKKVAQYAIEPLFALLLKQVMQSRYLQADETHIKVLEKDNAKSMIKGYYWVFNDPVQKISLFTYHPGRGREGPKELLTLFSGTLQADGYSVYKQYEEKGNIELMHCWAHARRYFEKAYVNKEKIAEYALNKISILYECAEACLSYSPCRTRTQRPAQMDGAAGCQSTTLAQYPYPGCHTLHHTVMGRPDAVLQQC